jgi:hypothetical protein
MTAAIKLIIEIDLKNSNRLEAEKFAREHLELFRSLGPVKVTLVDGAIDERRS